jgi:hypothetical protein
VQERWFTLVAATSLALAIGANTTIFSVAKPLLFERLDVPHAGSLRLITATDASFSYPIYEQLRTQNQVLGDLPAFHATAVNARSATTRSATSATPSTIENIAVAAPIESAMVAIAATEKSTIRVQRIGWRLARVLDPRSPRAGGSSRRASLVIARRHVMPIGAASIPPVTNGEAKRTLVCCLLKALPFKGDLGCTRQPPDCG